ncbi:MAG: oligosaccharide flippase family protein [Candidatus Sumerlaeia bacterium]|nr:oligosaccharide flippase family protein [Candidatus Sumerlaeia bacterium]
MTHSPFAATRWVLASSVGFRIVAIFGQWIILRLVEKEVFGAYRGIVSIHLMLLALLPLGMDMLLVREKSRRARYAVALSWLLALAGGVLSLGTLVAALAPAFSPRSLLASLLDLEGDYAAALLMAPIFAVQAFKLAVRAPLSARLDFRKISIAEFGNGVITWIGGALAVIAVPNAFALLAAYLAGELFEFLFMLRGERWEPSSVFQRRRLSIVKTLWRRHRRFCLFNAVDLTVNNVASLAPGVLLLMWVSKEANADFQVAATVIVLPVMLLVGAIHRVTFPTISGLSDVELHHRCLAIVGAGACFIAPAVIGFAVFAESTVWILGGAKYASAAALVPWMAGYMFLTAIYSPISSLDVVRDRPEVGMYWNLLHLAVRVAVLWLFHERGATFAIAAMAVASTLLWLLWVWLLGELLAAGMERYFRAVVRFAPMWMVAGAGFWLAERFAAGRPFELLLGPLFGIPVALFYLALVWKFHPLETRLLKKLARGGR